MKLSQLKIDPEFQSKIPPLQFEEEQQLEQNIIAEGRLLNPIITWNGYILDGQNTVEARRTCNGGMELPIRCKVFYGLTKEDEATLFAIQTGNATCLTAGERLRANLVAENPDALYFVGITSNAGVEFAYDGIRAPWKIYCIETAYELYKQYGCERYVEMLHAPQLHRRGRIRIALHRLVDDVKHLDVAFPQPYCLSVRMPFRCSRFSRVPGCRHRQIPPAFDVIPTSKVHPGFNTRFARRRSPAVRRVACRLNRKRVALLCGYQTIPAADGQFLPPCKSAVLYRVLPHPKM